MGKSITAFVFLLFVLAIASAFVSATVVVQKNNVCITTTEKELGMFKQVIECDYWRNSSNQSVQTTFSGSGGGSMMSNVYIGNPTGSGDDLLPQSPILSPDAARSGKEWSGVIIGLAFITVSVLGMFLTIKKKKGER
ncbi:MAG: hypothetical protein HY376_03150 [Candidatus Blackburnbacteria bacterium]|nr:hypothetical protein [Candidatus Blackburnbacteria bacterium]